MNNQTQDGWYQVTNRQGQSVVYWVADKRITVGAFSWDINRLRENSNHIERVEVCTVGMFNALVAERDELKVTVALANLALDALGEHNGQLKQEVRQQGDDWLALVRQIAKLDTSTEWELTDDSTLLEQFDPWHLLRQLADLQRKWDCVREADKYQAEMDAEMEADNE